MARRWVFTVWPGKITNNFSLDEWWNWFRVQSHTGVRYIVAQKELAPVANRRPGSDGIHIQGYIHFTGQKRPSTIGVRYDLQPTTFTMARGTPADNRAYCTKSDTKVDGEDAYEMGECPGGQGSKLTEVALCIKTKGLKRAIEDSPHTYICHGRGMRDLDNFYKRQKIRSTSCHVIVIHGESGAGKSYWGKNLYDPGNTFTMPAVPKNGAGWFDGYDGERTLLIDEFSGRIEFELFKNMLDPYPIQVPTKGDFTPAMWDTVVITTNYHPCTWYPNDMDSWGSDPNRKSPVERRIHTYITANGIYDLGTHVYTVTSWVTGTASGDIQVLPTREDESGPVPTVAITTPASNASEDPDLEQLLGSWMTEDQAIAMDFMPSDFVPTDTTYEGDNEDMGDNEGFDQAGNPTHLFPGFDVQ